MKNILLLLSFLMSIFTMHSQNIQQLEAKPSFKGITIGMPISEISNKLSFEKSSNGYSIYKVTDAYYYSIFNYELCKSYRFEWKGTCYRSDKNG